MTKRRLPSESRTLITRISCRSTTSNLTFRALKSGHASAKMKRSTDRLEKQASFCQKWATQHGFSGVYSGKPQSRLPVCVSKPTKCFGSFSNGQNYAKRGPAHGPGTGGYSSPLCLAQRSPAHRPAIRLWPRPVRCLFRPARRQRGPFLRHAPLHRRQSGNHHAGRSSRSLGQTQRSFGGRRQDGASSRPAGLDRGADSALRLLPERYDDRRHAASRKQSQSHRLANQSRFHHIGPIASSLSLRQLHRHHGRRKTRRVPHGEGTIAMATTTYDTTNICGATLSRRQFVKTGGALVVGITLVGSKLLAANRVTGAPFKNTLDPTLPNSWIEIHPDSTVLIRTGKSDFGQGTTFTAYRQIVADELGVPFDAITTVIAGDTDRTPDGSGAFDFLGRGTPNIRKAAAYTYQALLDLASERLGVPKDQLTGNDGVVSGGGKSISYGDLVRDQQLKLTIPVRGDLTSIFGLTVDGNPPMKPVSEYKFIGKSMPNSIIVSKVTAKEVRDTDVRLPGYL